MQRRLKRMLNPQSAVFIGGSALVPAIDYCRTNRFKGNIYVVNPFKAELAGIPCHASLADLPDVPDVAFIGVPKEIVVSTVQALSDMGVGGAVCNSAGFSEIEGEGIERQAAFVAAAGEMPILGPNCPGMANFVDNAVFMQDHFGDHADVEAGVAVISNGGAYLSDVGTADRSVPLAYSFGMGNQAVTTIAELFDVLLDDARVKAVNLYLEAVRDVSKLSRAALKAVRQGVPVVVVKGGRSSAGQRATQTHTASLAGDDVVMSALFERLGFIQCATPDEALETLKMLIFTGRPQGRNVAFTTSSGSYAVLGADVAESVGLEIPALDDAIFAQLTPLMPSYILPANPLDISNGQMFPRERQEQIFNTFLAGDFDLAVQVMCFPPPGGWEPSSWYLTTDVFAKVASKRGLPAAFINTLADALPLKARNMMIANGIAPLQGLQHGFRAVANAVLFDETCKRLNTLPDEAILLPIVQAVVTTSVVQLDEAAAKALLREAGVEVPKSVVWDGELASPHPPAPSPNARRGGDSSAPGGDSSVPPLVLGGVRGGLAGLEFPVVVKAISAQLTHKTEVGAVALNIETPDAVLTTVHTMQKRLKSHPVSGYISGYIIEEMITDGIAELLIGIRQVPNIGLALTLAFGGIAVELLRDSATLLLPAPPTEIERALRRLKLFPLLNGWRGKPAANIDHIVNTISAICAFADAHRESLIALEINPLIVRPNDKGVVAVDAVLQFSVISNQ